MSATTVDIGTAVTIVRAHSHPWHAAAVIALVFVFALVVAITIAKLAAKDKQPQAIVDCARCRHEHLTDTPDGTVDVHCLGCHTDFALLDYLHHPCAHSAKVPVA